VVYEANQDVAARLGIWPQTVTKWRKRFLDRRLEGLADEPRPGAPRRITDEQIEDVIVKTLESTPADATHWSRASMAKRSGLSQSSIGRIWKAFGLKPHLADTFKLSNVCRAKTLSLAVTCSFTVVVRPPDGTR
jgi:transposase